jgi:uncharacterized protein
MFIRFYGCLNDFLRKPNRGTKMEISISAKQSIKDVIESKGVPHTEVALIIINGNPVKFDYFVNEGDYVSVYPPFFNLNISAENNLQISAPTPLRFVADAHLGRLARYLRMLGHDCVYRSDLRDREIIDFSVNDGRVVLTRDVGILKENKTKYGYFIRSQLPKEQLMEVILRYGLHEDQSPFKRCMMCNGLLKKVDKNDILHRLPQNTRIYFNKFFQCEQCEKVYWEGSHYDEMKRFIDDINRGGMME